jgi:hypothetical protein
MVKIGITIHNLNNISNRIYSCGIHQHIISFFNYLKNRTNADVFFISNNINNNNYPNAINHSDINKLIKLNIIISVGLELLENIIIKFKDNNVKFIKYTLGHSLINGITEVLHNCYNCNNNNNLSLKVHHLFDEIWISPHFGYSIDYHKYIHSNDNVLIGPYFWESSYMGEPYQNELGDNLNIGVFESNLLYNKSCFIPIIICEKSKEYINKCYITGSKKLYDKSSYFKQFANRSELFKSKRLTFENRHRFRYVMDNYCNVVVSFSDDCDLNYLHLECFYLGIPIIHNSKMLKDWGYYYPKCDVNAAVEHIKNLKKSFNRLEYIEKHKPLLYKYSLQNQENIDFFNEKLKIETKI